jgi:hypothetical protein
MITLLPLKKLLASGLVVCLVVSCDSRARPNLDALLGSNAHHDGDDPEIKEVPKFPLTGDLARAALVDLLRANPRAFQRELDPQEALGQPVKDGRAGHIRAGRFSIDLNERSYAIVVRYGCIFDYRGTFEFKGGRWVASKPHWVSAALVK